MSSKSFIFYQIALVIFSLRIMIPFFNKHCKSLKILRVILEGYRWFLFLPSLEDTVALKKLTVSYHVRA